LQLPSTFKKVAGPWKGPTTDSSGVLCRFTPWSYFSLGPLLSVT